MAENYVTSIGSNLNLRKFSPEPDSSFLQRVGTTARNLAGYAGTAAQFAGGAALGSEFAGLIQTQSEAQMQMMVMSMHSNLSRTDHETRMAAVRNMRVA